MHILATRHYSSVKNKPNLLSFPLLITLFRAENEYTIAVNHSYVCCVDISLHFPVGSSITN